MDNNIVLQRITDNQLATICKGLELELQQITPHQLRVGNFLDFYPKRNRYFLLKEKKWGTASSPNDLYKIFSRYLPEYDQATIDVFKEWYADLLKQPDSERMSGQLTMITSVLKVMLSEEEFKELTEVKNE